MSDWEEDHGYKRKRKGEVSTGRRRVFRRGCGGRGSRNGRREAEERKRMQREAQRELNEVDTFCRDGMLTHG